MHIYIDIYIYIVLLYTMKCVNMLMHTATRPRGG